MTYSGSNEAVVGVEEGERSDIRGCIIFTMNRMDMRRFFWNKDHKRIVKRMRVRGSGGKGFTEERDRIGRHEFVSRIGEDGGGDVGEDFPGFVGDVVRAGGSIGEVLDGMLDVVLLKLDVGVGGKGGARNGFRRPAKNIFVN